MRVSLVPGGVERRRSSVDINLELTIPNLLAHYSRNRSMRKWLTVVLERIL
jgi:hypothetical protein